MPPSRGEIWHVDLDPTRGHEQAGQRPALVVSVDLLNSGPAGLVIVVPLTTTFKAIPLHVELEPPEAGLRHRSWVKPEDVRSISIERLSRRLGAVSARTLELVDDRLRVVLGL